MFAQPIQAIAQNGGRVGKEFAFCGAVGAQGAAAVRAVVRHMSDTCIFPPSFRLVGLTMVCVLLY